MVRHSLPADLCGARSANLHQELCPDMPMHRAHTHLAAAAVAAAAIAELVPDVPNEQEGRHVVLCQGRFVGRAVHQ